MFKYSDQIRRRIRGCKVKGGRWLDLDYTARDFISEGKESPSQMDRNVNNTEILIICKFAIWIVD